LIDILIDGHSIAKFKKDGYNYLIDYQDLTLQNSISLSLPNSKRFYSFEHRFVPFFETFLPEGYLYEIFKNLLTKEYGYIDDYLIFSLLAPNLDTRLRYTSDFEKLDFDILDKDEILNNDTKDTFATLLQSFLNKNAIGGVQPKTVAIVRDKDSLKFKEFIVKTWGDEFPYLAENEYFCMRVFKKAGLNVANVELSKNKNFLLVENFIRQKGLDWGFEEILSLQDKNRTKKYNGSYEQIAKIIMQFSTKKYEDMQSYFKMVALNYMLKNGDAHLKNFGLLYNRDFTQIELAPAYDIVTTTAYIYKDKPALNMFGKKVWFNKNEILEFGQKYCMLKHKDALTLYQECQDALTEVAKELREYITHNPHFKKVGELMLQAWEV
jgi:serine/threonine-protein kinase HipA